MRHLGKFFWLSFVAFTAIASGESEEVVPGPSDGFRASSGMQRSIPNVELPGHVLAEAGMLTLFADFEQSEESLIPVYLVNRTAKEVSLAVQDNDIYMRLEFLDENGLWVRAQTHRRSWCGNSYYAIELPAGSHFKMAGYYPSGGKKAKVRYRSQQANLTSNSGMGAYLDEDVIAASFDDMAARQINGSLGWMLKASEDLPFARERTATDYLLALELLSEFSESPYYRREAEKMVEQWGEQSVESKRIQTILEESWPNPPATEKEGEVLVGLCLRKMLSESPHFLHWEIIASEVKQRSVGKNDLSSDLLVELVPQFESVLGSEDQVMIQSAVKLFEASKFINEFVTTEALHEWLHSGNEKISIAAATHLAKRGDFDTLVSYGVSVAGEHEKYQILGLLASEGRDFGTVFYPRGPESDEEREFWRSCLKEDPILSVRCLPKTSDRYNVYSRVVQGPVKEFLESYVTTMGSDSREAESLSGLSQLVRFFGTWRMEENVPVLKALLKHPEYTENEGWSSKDGRYLRRDYRIRRDARDALLQMRIAVDPEVVFEEKIALPDLPEKLREEKEGSFGF